MGSHPHHQIRIGKVTEEGERKMSKKEKLIIAYIIAMFVLFTLGYILGVIS